MNRWLLPLLAVLLIVTSPTPAFAHHTSAVLSLDPSTPKRGGTGTIQVNLLDPYGNPLPVTAVRASFGEYGEAPPPWLPLESTQPGIFSAPLSYPDSDAGFIRLEVDFPDEQVHAILPVRLGVDWFTLKDHVIELSEGSIGTKRKAADPIPANMLPDQATPTPTATVANGRWVLPTVLLAAVGTAATVLLLRRARQRQANP